MSLGNALHLYLIRLRARRAQELLALVGIAAGVALLFASLVATRSLTGSVAQLNAGIVGRATLQLQARGAEGFPQGLLARVRAIPGVRIAAPILEVNARLAGPRGARPVELVGADEQLGRLGGALVRRVALTPFPGLGALVLPAPLARTLGLTVSDQEMTVEAAGRRSRAPLFATLSGEQIGGLSSSPIAVAPLEYAQQLTGLRGRLTRVLVEPEAHAGARVRAALGALAAQPGPAGRLDVRPADWELRLFAKAASATNQSTSLFAVISALVGFLFAFNAVLLTAPQRRRLIADLRRDGYAPRVVIGVLLGDALGLGVAACVVGLALGDELSLHLFHANPDYLSSAFALGGGRVVGWQPPVFATLGGLGAAILAVLSPLRDVLARDPLAALAAPGASPRRVRRRTSALGTLALALSVLTMLSAPSLAVWGMVALAAALLLLLPVALELAALAVRALTRHLTSAAPPIATMELRAGRTRAAAIAATCGIAVFGASAILAAREDLLTGLDGAARDVNAIADVWVAPSGSSSLLLTQPFSARGGEPARAIAGVHGARSLAVYRGALLDVGERRVWVLGPSSSARPLVPASQLIEGQAQRAAALLRRGGWAVISLALAQERHARVGDYFTIPSPFPLRVRIAATSTNFGWAPGAILLGAGDFARAWGSDQPAAFAVRVAPGFDQTQVARAIDHALSPRWGLSALSARAREQRQRALTRQGLARLTQIAALILIAAALAVAAVMGAMIWQRRPRLAKLKLEGFSRGLLWRTIVLESIMLVGAGSVLGGLLALLGQRLLDQALERVVNYPVVVSLGLLPALAASALVTAAAVSIVAIPGRLAVRVPAAAAMEE